MSERVQMMDCGDGIRRADNGCFARVQTPKTANFTLAAADTGKMFTNRGAVGAIVATLPTAVKGLFFVLGAPTAQTFTVTATGGAKIDGGAANGSLIVLPGSLLFLRSDGTDWYSSLPIVSSSNVSSSNALTAFAGGGQGGALQLTSAINRVTTVGTAADSVKLPVAAPGLVIYVTNAAAANSMNVFPSTGDAINALAANAAFAVAANKTATFVCAVAGFWNAILTA